MFGRAGMQRTVLRVAASSTAACGMPAQQYGFPAAQIRNEQDDFVPSTRLAMIGLVDSARCPPATAPSIERAGKVE